MLAINTVSLRLFVLSLPLAAAYKYLYEIKWFRRTAFVNYFDFHFFVFISTHKQLQQQANLHMHYNRFAFKWISISIRFMWTDHKHKQAATKQTHTRLRNCDFNYSIAFSENVFSTMKQDNFGLLSSFAQGFDLRIVMHRISSAVKCKQREKETERNIHGNIETKYDKIVKSQLHFYRKK